MSGQITKLKAQKRNPQRVNVYLDGQFAFGLALIEAAQLQIGQFLSDEDVARLLARDAVERAAGQTMNLLSYRPRSQAEVRQRLAGKGYEDSAVDDTVDRLNRAGLLDDREFARYWVDNRFQFNPRGKVALQSELRKKGVDQRVIQDVLETYDEEAAAVRAAEAAVRRLQSDDLATFRRKLYEYLSRRGFAYAVVQPIVEQAAAERELEASFGRNEE